MYQVQITQLPTRQLPAQPLPPRRTHEHNEQGLAFDTLQTVVSESSWESQRVFELLALAAASMGLIERQQALDEHLSKSKGWEYETVLPPEDT